MAGIHASARDLIGQGEQLFRDRQTLVSLWQEIADHFYPERADFTASRTLGEDFAANLNSSYPLMVRRELGNSISAMTRRKDTEWMRMSIQREDRLDNAGREWLEWATGVQRSAMYDPAARFERGTKECDHDYISFGQGILSQEINWKKTTLLYRNWHPRDIAWCEGDDGSISDRHHNVLPTARWLAEQFGEEKLHPKVLECLRPGKNPYQKINSRRIVLPAGNYDDISKGRKIPWVSIYIDVDNQWIIDERPSWTPVYIIPRWQTVSGSQYAYSPAVVAGLPDARLIQAMTLTILEAGEMSVRPPMMKTGGNIIQGEVQLFAGGITEVDQAHDERLGAALRPVFDGRGDLPFGIEILERKESQLADAFCLNKLRALPIKDNMTAYEASVWTKDYIRQALPLFEPLESEYNAPLCEQTFEDLMRANAFGSYEDIPQSIRGMDLEWKFKSPLSDAIEEEKAQKFLEAKALIAEAVALDPASAGMLDARVALREALTGKGIPAKWLRSEAEVEAHAEQVAQQQQEAAEAATQQQQAATAVDAGKAVESFSQVAA